MIIRIRAHKMKLNPVLSNEEIRTYIFLDWN